MVERAAKLAGLTPEDLHSASRRARVVEARRALAQVAVAEFGRPGAAVARHLGVATSTVNRQAAGEANEVAKALLEDLGLSI